MLADKRDRYRLTIGDFASRYLIAREALATTKEASLCLKTRLRSRPAKRH
jgi:hypothetical protein